MPELPEVEVVRQSLEKIVLAKPAIQSFEFFRKDLRNVIPVQAFRKLEGQKITAIQRRAKYLIFRLENALPFVSHLGMTGNWRLTEVASDTQLHDHLRIVFTDRTCLTYNDPRRFGFFEVLDSKTEKLRFGHLGPEPLSEEWNGLSLWQSLRGKSVAIKTAIMDQRVVVGVGNIYACEALFQAGIRPSRKASRVSKIEAQDLVKLTKDILKQAILGGGSSVSDFHNPLEQEGKFQNNHQVYGRKGESCLICNTPLRVSVISGRSSFWCSLCQN